MSDFETAHQLEQARASHEGIPVELAFEDVIKNRTSPPCSLNDFMDYLFYVEHNAESLQFFLWYCDYIQRWSGLLPRQKALSQPWDPEKATEPRSRFITYSHKRARSDKMGKIINIMEMESERKSTRDSSSSSSQPPEASSRKSTSSSSTTTTASFSHPRTPSSASVLSPTESTKEDWQPFTIQPFRDEISRVVRQYIAESAPRQLNLSPKDRESCLRAAQHTTHPSALLPAFTLAEANLRSRHPSFIRWSRSNTNPARNVFSRVVGLLLILLGFGIDILLILSHRSHYLRIMCLVPWWPGITIFIAGWRCLCIVLHFRKARQLRPWEQECFDEDGTDDGSSQDSEKHAGRIAVPQKENKPPLSESASQQQQHQHTHTQKNHSVSSTTSSRIDPLRKESLQTFGPRNEYVREEGWLAAYRRKTLAQRVWDETMPVQNRALRILQDRAVFFAVLWGGIVASTLTVGSLFIPSGNLIM
ncbi:hypothetical protein B0H66DRAFT_642403 [Apodospora peruviana]|uniref:RGS domain-containing protein n=1 Tax=Apodospora peruviana TaxID=516989 RepID=A0AAE0M143_9PEZI|nr:hypothetical protein B0H66DRAFT_642403 [Apodospora peruviana]